MRVINIAVTLIIVADTALRLLTKKAAMTVTAGFFLAALLWTFLIVWSGALIKFFRDL